MVLQQAGPTILGGGWAEGDIAPPHFFAKQFFLHRILKEEK